MEDQNIVRVHVVVPEGFDNPGQPTGGNSGRTSYLHRP